MPKTHTELSSAAWANNKKQKQKTKRSEEIRVTQLRIWCKTKLCAEMHETKKDVIFQFNFIYWNVLTLFLAYSAEEEEATKVLVCILLLLLLLASFAFVHFYIHLVVILVLLLDLALFVVFLQHSSGVCVCVYSTFFLSLKVFTVWV